MSEWPQIWRRGRGPTCRNLEEIESFPWSIVGKIDALGDPLELDLGKRGKLEKRRLI